MRTIFITIFCLAFFSFTQYGQTQNQFKYQAAIRDADGQIISNQEVFVNISILQGSAAGVSVFDEVHFVNTNEYGIMNFNIGSVNDLSVIDWTADTYFLEVSVNGYVLGITQLLSVPYALQAKYCENIDDSDANPLNELQNLNLNGTFLEIDNGVGADLGILQDGTGTDNQLLDLSVNLLSIEDGNGVDLSLYLDNTDNQTLDLTDNILTITGGNTVDFNPYLDNTDNQNLYHNGTILSIDNGNFVDLSSYLDNTDNQSLLEVLTEGNDAGNQAISNLADPVYDQDAVTKSYLDVFWDEKSLIGEIKMFALSESGVVTKETLQSRGWAICDGTTSNFQGITGAVVENTPNLTNRFIRMSDDESSGTTGGHETHKHESPIGWYGSNGPDDGDDYVLTYANGYATHVWTANAPQLVFKAGTELVQIDKSNRSNQLPYTNNVDGKPPYYELVFFIKVK